MKNNCRLLLLTVVFCLAGLISCSELSRLTSGADSPSAPRENRYDPEQVKKRLDSGEEIFLLDVREPNELEEGGAIEGYVNIPMSQLETRLEEVPKDRPVVIY